MEPPPEVVHWMFAAGFVFLGLCLLAETIVGRDVWRRRSWRAYLWPGVAFVMGLFMWPVMVFFTSSAIHMLAHGAWAQAMMLAGAAQLGLVRGKLRSRLWELTMPFALVVSGGAFLIHEQNPWLFSRSAFLHHALGWTMLVGALFPLGRFVRPRSPVFNAGFALVFIAISVLLFCDRNVAPIFGHLSPLAGGQ
ncbi:MAG TPA: hypothetical protein VGQ68_07885 [Gaiellaceae bacterium]|nr:hypothetical protein [Gaiellaceae bacterium]